MGFLLNINLLGVFLFFIIVIQANPLFESSKSTENNQNKLSKNKQQLYEIYKAMRTDPRFNSISNHELISFIYRNFLNENKYNMDLIKQKIPNLQRQQNAE